MFYQKVWVFWLNLRLVMNEVQPIYCFLSREKDKLQHFTCFQLETNQNLNCEVQVLVCRTENARVDPGRERNSGEQKGCMLGVSAIVTGHPLLSWGSLTYNHTQVEKWTKESAQSLKGHRILQIYSSPVVWFLSLLLLFYFIFPQKTNQKRQWQYISVIQTLDHFVLERSHQLI